MLGQLHMGFAVIGISLFDISIFWLYIYNGGPGGVVELAGMCGLMDPVFKVVFLLKNCHRLPQNLDP